MKKLLIMILFTAVFFPSFSSGENQSDALLQETNLLNQKVIELFNATKYEEAIPYAKRILEIREKALGKNHPKVAESMNDLGVLYSATGRHEKAEALLKKALEIRERTLCKGDPNILESLKNLKDFYKAIGSDKEVSSLSKRISKEKSVQKFSTTRRNPIGLLLAGYEEDCKLKRKCESGLNKCEYKMELYKGDEIIKFPDIKAVKIQWMSPPYTGAKELNKTKLRVFFNPPDKKKLFSRIKDALAFIGLSEIKPVTTLGVTRGISSEVAESPNNNATLLLGYPVTFIRNKKGGKAIIFKDSKENIVFQEDLKGQTIITFTPEELGLKPSEVYTWNITGIQLYKQFKVSLLRNDIAQQIINDLKKIDGKKDISSDEKNIEKAVYLQLMSDTYPEEMDLYWLSYQMLKTSSDSDVVKKLKNRYLKHLHNTLSE